MTSSDGSSTSPASSPEPVARNVDAVLTVDQAIHSLIHRRLSTPSAHSPVCHRSVVSRSNSTSRWTEYEKFQTEVDGNNNADDVDADCEHGELGDGTCYGETSRETRRSGRPPYSSWWRNLSRYESLPRSWRTRKKQARRCEQVDSDLLLDTGEAGSLTSGKNLKMTVVNLTFA